jgi:hypothetical protein
MQVFGKNYVNSSANAQQKGRRGFRRDALTNFREGRIRGQFWRSN